MKTILLSLKHKLYSIKQFMQVILKTVKLLYETSKVMLVCIICLNFINGLITPIQLFIWKNFIDIVTNILIGNGKLNDAILVLLMYMAAMLISDIGINLSVYFETIYSELLNNNIVDKMLEKIINLQLSDFDDSEIYNRIKKINDETLYRPMNVLQTLILFIRDIVNLSGMVYIVSVVSTSALIIYIISVIPAFIVSLKVFSKWFDIFSKRCEALRFVDFAKNIFLKHENIKELKISNSGMWFKNLINNTYLKYIKEDKKIRKGFLIETNMVKLFEYIVSSVVKIYLLLLSIKNKYSIGMLVMLISSIDNLKSSVHNILNYISSFYENSLYMKELFILLEKKTVKNINKKKFNGNFKKIVFKNVYFKYPNSKEYVLEDLNFEICANKFYSIVGINGVGKTTIIKLLINLYLPTKGEIFIDDVNIKYYDSYSVFNKIGCLFQDFIKYPLSVEKNIGIGDYSNVQDEKRIKYVATISGANTFIDKLPKGYKTLLGKEWSEATELSLGQWQKIAISRALMKKAKLIIMDEPTASLDAISEYNLFKNWGNYISNLTTILITHKLSAVKLSDKIFVLKDKTIIEQGTHKQLLDYNGEYKKMYEIQNR